jgi:hypothetical protein
MEKLYPIGMESRHAGTHKWCTERGAYGAINFNPYKKSIEIQGIKKKKLRNFAHFFSPFFAPPTPSQNTIFCFT